LCSAIYQNALSAGRVSAVVPTRGDVDLGPIVRHLASYPQIGDIFVVVGGTPFNRYRVMAQSARTDVVFTQDDDCITDLAPVLAAYEPGIIVNAMTPEHAANYPGRQTLLGFGSIFDRAMVAALDGWEHDALFLREADRVFTALHPHKSVYPKIEILPYAHAPNRMYRQPDHAAARDSINRRILERTGIVA